MTDNYTGLFKGPIDQGVYAYNAIANEALDIGSPVILVAPATGELLPRMGSSTDGTLFVAGVVIDGDARGNWVDGTAANDGASTSAAGQTCSVCALGRCKVRVNGSTGGANSNIALGDPLSIGGAAEIAQRAVAADFVFARALQTSTGAADAIACMVTLEGIL